MSRERDAARRRARNRDPDSARNRGRGDGPRTDGGDAPVLGEADTSRRPYTESQVIMTTVKVIIPFVFTYGLFVIFHGADSPGGGFQGGALVASVFILMAFAFGIDATRDWLSNVVIVGLAAVGVAVFGLIGIGSMVVGGGFLEYARYPIAHSAAYGIEAVEIGGIALIVAGVLTGLFFLLAVGVPADETDETGVDSDADSESDAAPDPGPEPERGPAGTGGED